MSSTHQHGTWNDRTPTWCPGCGDWAIHNGLQRALSAQNLTPSDLMVIFGVGCSGNMNDFLHAYALHSLHGRAIPTAVGAKLANPEMPVVVVAGDGDTYGEGGNHLLHACRGNHDVTLIIHDNSVYGLTTGQVAPTALHGTKSKSTPQGMIELPVSPLNFLITQGASFVAQSFAGNLNHVSDMIEQAMQHSGFSVVNILQPCVSFNRVNTYQYYLEKSFMLPESHDPTNKRQAIDVALAMDEEKYGLGIVYKSDRPAYHACVTSPQQPLVSFETAAPLEPLLSDFA